MNWWGSTPPMLGSLYSKNLTRPPLLLPHIQLLKWYRAVILILLVIRVGIDILLTCWIHLHDRLTSLRVDVRVSQTSLTTPLVIEVPVSKQESGRSYIFVLEYWNVLFLPFSTWFQLFWQRMVILFSVMVSHNGCFKRK